MTGYDVVDGSFAVVDGNDQPTYTTAHTFGTDTTAVTLNEANKYATLAAAVIRVYKSCDVKGAYAAKYSEGIVLDGPQTRADYEDQLPSIFVDRPAFGAAIGNPARIASSVEMGNPSEREQSANASA